MALFQIVAFLGYIDTPEMRAAIKSLDTIPELHRYQICNCLTTLQYRISQGENVEYLLTLGYQDIREGLEPTPEALTEEQRVTIYNIMIDNVKICVENLVTEIEAAKKSTEIPA